MHQHLENQVIRGLDTQKLLAYDKMTAAADRKELRQTLHKTENYRFKPFHILLLFFLFAVFREHPDY